MPASTIAAGASAVPLFGEVRERSFAVPAPAPRRSVPAREHTRCGAPLMRRRKNDVSVGGIRRSPVVTPDIVVGKGEEEVRTRRSQHADEAQAGAHRRRRGGPMAAASRVGPCSSCCAQQSIDLFNYLLRQRIIFLAGYVNDKVGVVPRHGCARGAAPRWRDRRGTPVGAARCRWRPRSWAASWRWRPWTRRRTSACTSTQQVEIGRAIARPRSPPGRSDTATQHGAHMERRVHAQEASPTRCLACWTPSSPSSRTCRRWGWAPATATPRSSWCAPRAGCRSQGLAVWCTGAAAAQRTPADHASAPQRSRGSGQRAAGGSLNGVMGSERLPRACDQVQLPCVRVRAGGGHQGQALRHEEHAHHDDAAHG